MVRFVSGGEDSGYPEDWKSSVGSAALRKWARAWRKVPGLYVLVADEGKVIKAGMSTSLGSRINGHILSAATWGRTVTAGWVIPCDKVAKWEISLLQDLRTTFPERLGNETFSDRHISGSLGVHERALHGRVQSVVDNLTERIQARDQLHVLIPSDLESDNQGGSE